MCVLKQSSPPSLFTYGKTESPKEKNLVSLCFMSFYNDKYYCYSWEKLLSKSFSNYKQTVF